MTARTMKAILTALALTFALPAVYAQGTDTTPPAPAAPAPAATPAPLDTSPAPPPPVSAPKKHSRFRIGPEVGVYLPSSSKTRSQFGDTWVTLGLGLGSIGRISPSGQTSLDLQVLYQTKGDNHIFLAPLGIGYRTAISQSGAQTTYVGITGDLYLADLRSGDYDVHSGLRTGFGGSVLLGENFGDSGYLEARYLFVSRIKSFDLGGLNLTAGYRF